MECRLSFVDDIVLGSATKSLLQFLSGGTTAMFKLITTVLLGPL